MKKSLILLRGIPGSGKNTFADVIKDKDTVVCCADDYHMYNGKYVWKPENVNRAHMLCQNKAEYFMKKGSEKVIIANTNTTEKEMKPYYDLAAKYGYTVFSIIVENRANTKNIHGVPKETIEKMRNRFNVKL